MNLIPPHSYFFLIHFQLPSHLVQPVLDNIHKLLVVDVVVVYHSEVLLALHIAFFTLHLLQTDQQTELVESTVLH